MRVLHLGKYFPPNAGGIERFLDLLTAAQVAAGLDPSVLAHDPRRNDLVEEQDRPIRRVRAFGELLFVPISPTWPAALSDMLARERPQLLHIHLPNPWAFSLLASTAARRLPWVAHWHADIPRDGDHFGLKLAYPPYSLLENALLSRCRTIIATSQAYLDSSPVLARHRDRCHVVPLGIGQPPEPGLPPDWPGESEPSDRIRLLAVGRLSHYKGFEVLLDALTRIPDARLLLIGDGPLLDNLRHRSQQADLRDRVSIVGGVDDATLEAAYRACDAFVLPSINRAEAFGVVILEAMRASKPVIVSAVPGAGMGEIVVHGETGLHCRPGVVEDLIAAIERLQGDRATLQAMGQAGRRRLDAHYLITPVAQQIERIYRTLLPSADAAPEPSTTPTTEQRAATRD